MLKYEREYTQILKSELVPSLGCTEPISIAFVCSRAKSLLACEPKKMIISCSGNIIKNVKGVIVPNSGDKKGVKVSAILGMLGGDYTLGLEVLSPVNDENRQKCEELLKDDSFCEVELVENEENLYIKARLFSDTDEVCVVLEHSHTNITKEYKNDKLIFSNDLENDNLELRKDLLDFKDIYEYALNVDIKKVEDLISKQLECNLAIAKEGLLHPWGAQVGRTLKQAYTDNVKTRAKSLAAAGSDARMNGCLLPVVINSGSGNQGITVCVPVAEYAKELKSSKEELYRALILANLFAIYLKSGIGKLSAYCGVVSAAVAAMAGVCYLKGAGYDTICKCVINTLANDSGIVCDGAKSSCAAKIATALDAAILGHHMALDGIVFEDGDGLVKADIEEMLANISRLGKQGMKNTDVEILNMMIGC